MLRQKRFVIWLLVGRSMWMRTMWWGRALLQSDRNATLLIDVLRCYAAAGKFQLHDFVIMPDHVHLLITASGDRTIERAMPFIKGGFSHRLKKDFGYLGEVWHAAFLRCG